MQEESPRSKRFRWFALEALIGPRRRSSDAAYAVLCRDASLHFDAEGKYTNMGWWADGAHDLEAACEALLERCARWADLAERHDVLDVGCGTGGPLVYWSGLTPARIWGVNRSGAQAEVAAARVAAHPARQRLRVARADATALCFPDASFDCLLSVEAAFHFDRREDFFGEARRVLRPGAVLVMTDIVASRDHPVLAQISWWAFDRLMCAPRANRLTAPELCAQLEASGFKVEMHVCTRETIAGFFRAASRSLGDPLGRAASALLAIVFRHLPPVECVILRGTRPAVLEG